MNDAKMTIRLPIAELEFAKAYARRIASILFRETLVILRTPGFLPLLPKNSSFS